MGQRSHGKGSPYEGLGFVLNFPSCTHNYVIYMHTCQFFFSGELVYKLIPIIFSLLFMFFAVSCWCHSKYLSILKFKLKVDNAGTVFCENM